MDNPSYAHSCDTRPGLEHDGNLGSAPGSASTV